MIRLIWGLPRVVLMDSGFDYFSCIVQLHWNGLFTMTVIEKRAYWPKETEGEQIINHIYGKETGKHKVRKVRVLFSLESGYGLKQWYIVSIF